MKIPLAVNAINSRERGARMLSRLASVLDEVVMGFLALAALSLGVAPLLFELPRYAERGFDAAGWLIIALFALEYIAHFAAAADRRRFALDPWRMLDLAIIIAPLLALTPLVPGSALSSPALRMLRLFRILLFAPRVGHGLQRPMAAPLPPVPQGAPQVSILRPGASVPVPCDWAALLQWAAVPSGGWLHASNLVPERLIEIASAAGVSHLMIEAALHESSYPRIESGERWTALTLSLRSSDDIRHRDPVLLLIAENDVLSLAPHPLDLPQPPAVSGNLPWGPCCALHVIHSVLSRYEDLAGRTERTVRQLEELPAIESPASFFKETFRLKRVLSTAKGDLWRLRGLLDSLASGRRTLPGLGAERRAGLVQLAEEADYLYETVDDVREAVLSLIELHIDIAAHETNRFMRLLAIVSTLALIPAVVGGLLGMNLVEGPWPVTLGQIAFGTLVLMLAVLYAFLAKGHL
jgi:Mg2+ and Co2+ transporter CorA